MINRRITCDQPLLEIVGLDPIVGQKNRRICGGKGYGEALRLYQYILAMKMMEIRTESRNAKISRTDIDSTYAAGSLSNN